MSVRYLLDTNICIYIAKHNPPEVRERFARHAASELAMSMITLGELRFGAEKIQMRAELQKSGQIIGNNDLWLAAHARAEGWILVTNNEREFARVAGLQVENWVK
jgi:tRNA(fMet)-specific endonuclease VapC